MISARTIQKTQTYSLTRPQVAGVNARRRMPSQHFSASLGEIADTSTTPTVAFRVLQIRVSGQNTEHRIRNAGLQLGWNDMLRPAVEI